jgi:hypothetical protein
MASLRIEVPPLPLAPRWAVVSWIAALHLLNGRGDFADGYLMELVGLVLEGWEVKA